MKEIKKLRILCGLKQYRLAQELGYDQSNYANIENGKLIPNNIEQIKEKALSVLKPYLEHKITESYLATGTLERIKKQLYPNQRQTKLKH